MHQLRTHRYVGLRTNGRRGWAPLHKVRRDVETSEGLMMIVQAKTLGIGATFRRTTCQCQYKVTKKQRHNGYTVISIVSVEACPFHPSTYMDQVLGTHPVFVDPLAAALEEAFAQ